MRTFTISEQLVHEYTVADSVIQETRARLTAEWPDFDWDDEEIVQHLFECGELDELKEGEGGCTDSQALDRQTVESFDQ